ncbi:hypothetical protein WJX73_002284 [Symbiochloris irregularis]|uniref:RNA 3'-terminal-phosphate cyclase (ATP) n=1 Tax=Symbiochloris irregularis TaxID=706552 RepID=A0AAW1P4J5_9CHLO
MFPRLTQALRPATCSPNARNPHPALTTLHHFQLHATELIQVREMASQQTSQQPDLPEGGLDIDGSCVLLAQAALPCLLMCKPAAGSSLQEAQSTATLRGGTDATMAPPVGYMQHVLLPMLHSLFGIQAELQLFKRGFYPRGGGSMQLTVNSLASSSSLPGINLVQQPPLTDITIRAFTAGTIPEKVGQRMIDSARQTLLRLVGRDVRIHEDCQRETEQTAVGNGCGILLAATAGQAEGQLPMLGAAGLGERGVRAETVGETAARELAEDIASGACVDRWMQDQIIIFMALASQPSQVACGEPSLHTRTAMVVAEMLTGCSFRVLPPSGSQRAHLIHCKPKSGSQPASSGSLSDQRYQIDGISRLMARCCCRVGHTCTCAP